MVNIDNGGEFRHIVKRYTAFSGSFNVDTFLACDESALKTPEVVRGLDALFREAITQDYFGVHCASIMDTRGRQISAILGRWEPKQDESLQRGWDWRMPPPKKYSRFEAERFIIVSDSIMDFGDRSVTTYFYSGDLSRPDQAPWDSILPWVKQFTNKRPFYDHPVMELKQGRPVIIRPDFA